MLFPKRSQDTSQARLARSDLSWAPHIDSLVTPMQGQSTLLDGARNKLWVPTGDILVGATPSRALKAMSFGGAQILTTAEYGSEDLSTWGTATLLCVFRPQYTSLVAAHYLISFGSSSSATPLFSMYIRAASAVATAAIRNDANSLATLESTVVMEFGKTYALAVYHDWSAPTLGLRVGRRTFEMAGKTGSITTTKRTLGALSRTTTTGYFTGQLLQMVVVKGKRLTEAEIDSWADDALGIYTPRRRPVFVEPSLTLASITPSLVTATTARLTVA